MIKTSIEKITSFSENSHNYIGRKITIPSNNFKFDIRLQKFNKKTLEVFADQFNKRTKRETLIAWNAVEVLDSKSVKKKNIPENYEGSILGFVFADGFTNNPPLHNKAALMIDNDGKISIERVNINNGIRIVCRTHKIDIPAENRNLDGEKDQLPDFCYYDLLYNKEYIYANGRVIVNVAGNNIKEIIFSKPGQKISKSPFCLSLSIEDNAFPPSWDMREKELKLLLPNFENIENAIEIGPMIVENGKPVLDFDSEGIQSNTDSPGIAVGIDDSGNIIIITINNENGLLQRISFDEMAKIMCKNNIATAASFASTWKGKLMFNDKIIANSFPENIDADKELFSCAVLGYYDNK